MALASNCSRFGYLLDLLKRDKVGAARPWSSPCGDAGVAGGGPRRRRVGGMRSGTPVRLRAGAAAGEAPGGEGRFPHRILVRAELGSSLELMCSRGSPGLCRAPPGLSDEKVKNYMRSVTQPS